MRPITQALQPAGLVPGQPRMHRLARHPEPGRHLGHRLDPSLDHRQHGLIPLLSHTQLPHLGSVTHQPKQVSPINRNSVTHQPKPTGRHQPK